MSEQCPTPERSCPWDDDRLIRFGGMQQDTERTRALLNETRSLVQEQGNMLAALGAILQRMESKVDRLNNTTRKGASAGAIGGSAVTILAALAYAVFSWVTGGRAPTP